MTQIDKNIALNLKRIRKSKNMSLDMLAEQTGVSKSMLGQIERGESNPTVSTIGKIVEGLKVPFEQLIYNKCDVVIVPAMEDAPVFREKSGAFTMRTLLPFDAGRHMEIYQASLEKNARMDNDSYGEYAWEYVTVLQGEVDLIMNEEIFHIEENASLYFSCDRSHFFRNVGEGKAILNMVITRELH